MPDYQPMRDLQHRDARVMRLLDNGKERFGRWDADRECWVSTVDDRVRLRPVGWREMPGVPHSPAG